VGDEEHEKYEVEDEEDKNGEDDPDEVIGWSSPEQLLTTMLAASKKPQIWMPTLPSSGPD